jgi:hypothetical protein
MARSWYPAPSPDAAATPAPAPRSGAVTAARNEPASRGGFAELQDLIAQLLENTLSIVLADSPELSRAIQSPLPLRRVPQKIWKNSLPSPNGSRSSVIVPILSPRIRPR